MHTFARELIQCYVAEASLYSNTMRTGWDWFWPLGDWDCIWDGHSYPRLTIDGTIFGSVLNHVTDGRWTNGEHYHICQSKLLSIR